jgi:hypothetical protein
MKNIDYETPAYYTRLRPATDPRTHLLLDCIVILIVMAGLFALNGQAPQQPDPCRLFGITESSTRYPIDGVTIDRQSMWDGLREANTATDAIQS